LEIQRFYEYAKPSRFEKVARKHVIEQVRNHVKQQLPNYVLSVFGSEKTGVALALSDIDLRLVLKSQLQDPTITQFPPAPIKRRMGLEALNHLLNKNLRKNRAYLLPAIRYARYPLVSLQDRQSGLDVQIVLSNDTSVSRVIMQGYMEEYPYLRPVYYVVKTMLDVRGLSDVFRGGFGSYSLFMMLVASIKHRPHPRQDAAGALVNFFKFWRDLDTTKHGVSIEPTFFFNKAQQSVMRDKVRAQVKVRNPTTLYPISFSNKPNRKAK
jgi:non-canonical poly(A) RNA polymerase PAPD5/7